MTEPVAVVEKWLSDSAKTATGGQHEAFMDLISNKVRLLGVPGFELINYDDWYIQAKSEFSDGLVSEVHYASAHIVASGLISIIFRTVETVVLSDGPSDTNGIEGVLQKEEDGKWRLTHQRLLSRDEAGRCNLFL